MVYTTSSSVSLSVSVWNGNPWTLWKGLTFFLNMSWKDYCIAISCPRGYLISSSLHLAQSVSVSSPTPDSLNASFHSLFATTLYFSTVYWMTCLSAFSTVLLCVCVWPIAEHRVWNVLFCTCWFNRNQQVKKLQRCYLLSVISP